MLVCAYKNKYSLKHWRVIVESFLRRGPTIMDIILWDFLILYEIFFSPQVKQSVIIINKHDIYELPHELPNDLRL